MDKINKKRIDKIYQKLDSYSKLGIDGIVEYRGYIDDIVSNGQYYLLVNCLERRYNIECINMSIFEIKSNKIFNLIRSKTNSKIQEEIYELYKKNDIHQQGFDILNKSEKLGEIREISNNLFVVKGITSSVIDDSEISLLDKYKLAIDILIG